LTNTTFEQLGLAEPLLRALGAKNYITPTPIQAQAIPPLLKGRDLFGIARTGTGKTAAFGLPLMQQLSAEPVDGKRRKPRALILAPTRELAIQIDEEFRAYGRYLKLRCVLVFGGVGQRPQVDALNRGADIVIATPGRLLDLIGQGHARLDAVHHLVLDEADRMLDMGFVRDVRKIVAKISRKRQTLLFSATMPKAVATLAGELLSDPLRIEVTPESSTVELVNQGVILVPSTGKRALLAELLSKPEFSRVIVFARTKRGANRVAENLVKAGIAAEAIHGNKSQNARQRALEQFRGGRVKVLVATDIAARGIDVDDVSHVINFELPNEPESYVHRIGRTARAGASGAALSFCDPGERGILRDIERLTKQKLEVIEDRIGDGGGDVAPTRRPARGRPAPSKSRRRRPRNRRAAA
jgi:ATP-dependent RNA helicase RhlE